MRKEFDLICAALDAMGVRWHYNGFNFWIEAPMSMAEELNFWKCRWSPKKGKWYRRFELQEG